MMVELEAKIPAERSKSFCTHIKIVKKNPNDRMLDKSGKFIAFKTFLDERYDSQVPDEDRFHFPMLSAYLHANKVQLGLIIDLTNTTRFYDRRAIENEGVTYVKIQCRGHGEAPSIDHSQMFIGICARFFEKNPDKIIGVHCTHGFNRSGFLISSYLVEHEDWSIEAAVDAFKQARLPGIYKQDYLRDLWDRYGGGKEEAPSAPSLPDWCYEEEDAQSDEDDDGPVNGIRDGPRVKRRRREHTIKDPKFVEGVSSSIRAVHSPRLEDLQEICAEMCEWDRNTFPGCQVVSLDRNNVQYLAQKPYKVSWKADGTRYMMLILGKDEVYMFDRDNSGFIVPSLTFPQRKNPDEHIFDTLIDGELVMDREGDTVRPRYLIYDIVKFQGQDVGKTDLDRRFLCIDKEIIGPRNQMVHEGKLDKSLEPFSIRRKDFYNVEHSSWILEKLTPKILHETDGLVFQPAIDPYICGQCPFVLKWKPHELNSVDFQLQIKTVKQVGCLPEKVGALYVQGFDVPFSTIKVTPELKHYDKRIIECSWDGTQWKFMRIREDKSFPNAYKTAMSVCESIKHPVTKEILLDFINKHRFRPEHHHHEHHHHEHQHAVSNTQRM